MKYIGAASVAQQMHLRSGKRTRSSALERQYTRARTLELHVTESNLAELRYLVEYRSLKRLVIECPYNRIIIVHTLTMLPKTLEYLRISTIDIASLPPLPKSLKQLHCYHTQLTQLPELPLTIEVIHCDDNQLTELPELPPAVVRLRCGGNQITELPLLPESLTFLDIDGNPCATLPEYQAIAREGRYGRDPDAIRKWQLENQYVAPVLK